MADKGCRREVVSPVTRRDAVLLSLSAAASRLGYAKDPWVDKKPDEWSDKDIEKLLTRSPWAKEVYAAVDIGGGGSRIGSGGGGGRRGGGGGSMNAESSSMGGSGGDMGGGEGAMGGGGGRNRGGGGMPETPSRPEIKAIVRWETAPAIRAAQKQELPKDIAEHYVISLTTKPTPFMMGGGQGRPGGREGAPQQQDPAARRKAMAERMAAATTLERKGKDPIHPEHVASGQDQNQNLVVFFMFGRTGQPIVTDDKEVTFVSQMGPAQFKAKFNLKDMTFDGRLDL
jgi:hypothetical protein